MLRHVSFSRRMLISSRSLRTVLIERNALNFKKFKKNTLERYIAFHRRFFTSAANNGSWSRRNNEKDAPHFSRESTLDDVVSNKFGIETIHKPPLQSLYKAIVAGEVSMPPAQRVRKNGKVITTFSVATGGMWRLPLPDNVSESNINEDDCTDPCVQYHKVTIHDEGLGRLAVRTLKKGMQVYVEGELEVRVFNDTDTGAIRRDREIAVHSTGQIFSLTQKGCVPIDTVPN